MLLRDLFSLLEERLVSHDNNRKMVQAQLKEAHANMLDEVDVLEKVLSSKIRASFELFEGGSLEFIEMFNSNGDELNAFIEQAPGGLLLEQEYEIKPVAAARKFSESYEVRIYMAQPAKRRRFNDDGCGAGDKDKQNIEKLTEYLSRTYDSMIKAQNELVGICAKRREKVDEIESTINKKLEQLFTEEDARLQGAVNSIRKKINSRDPNVLDGLIKMAQMTLVTEQTYSLKELLVDKSFTYYDLGATKEADLRCINFGAKKPDVCAPILTEKKDFAFSLVLFKQDEQYLLDLLKPFNLTMCVDVMLSKNGGEGNMIIQKFTTKCNFKDTMIIPIRGTLAPNTGYLLKARIRCCGSYTQLSDVIEFAIPGFDKCCSWKESPDDVESGRKYDIDKKNSRVVAKLNSNGFSTIVGNTHVPLSAVTSWSINILKSKGNGEDIYIGITPFDISQNVDCNFNKYGWYFYCFSSTLYSGPPHNYSSKEYGPRKEDGEYVHTGDSVGVVMDTTKGELSFALNRVNLGVAYEGIPLDKPLVPCVILWYQGDSIELDPSEVKEAKVDSSIPIPSNLTAKSITWGSIVLTWDKVSGATFYQIEVGGSNLWCISANAFIKKGLLSGSGHSFRVRTVRGSSVSEWSGVVKGRALKWECAWKECPGDVDEYRKYSVDERNPRVASMDGGGWCTIIGNTPIPPNAVTSWSIRMLKSKNINTYGIYIGVAPFDINQNSDDNNYKCGWYFDCYRSGLLSGPPHNYNWKEYGPKKGRRQHAHTADSAGVVIDTTKGEFSFALDNVNLGVAYEGIPLDKPLVPCVLLKYQYDSVELII